MQLLVSVRSAAEVEPALAGGADIIDAKEPAHGPLGPVAAATLAAILARVPITQPFSIALGDVTNTEAVVAALAALELPSRTGPTFVKLGFAQVASPELVGSLLREGVARAAARPSKFRLVAVAYADAVRAGSLSPDVICRLAHAAGAAGVLMDTFAKDGTGLLEWWNPPALARWISNARELGLVTGLAGALSPDDVVKLSPVAPDVLGFRGAACEAGRLGEVSARLVARLRHRIDWSTTRLGTYAHDAARRRETRYRIAYPAPGSRANSREIND